MKPIDCSRLQAKRFFSALCYASQHITLFERQLVELPEKDWPTVLLASIIIDNSGLSRIRNEVMNVVASLSKTCIDTYSDLDHEESTSSMKCNNEHWVEVPNQYILQNRAWLLPVIRACDPEKITFTENDYGTRLLDSLSEKLGIKLKNENGVIFFELKHSLDVMILIAAEPDIIGVARPEVDSVMNAALTGPIYDAVKKMGLIKYRQGREFGLQDNDELSKGLILLVIMTLLFAFTGLFLGFYCGTDESRDATTILSP